MRIDGLTSRRWEIAVLVADGLTDKQISEALGIALRTVNAHVHDIGLHWRLDATRDLRVQIVKRVTAYQASQFSNSVSKPAA